MPRITVDIEGSLIQDACRTLGISSVEGIIEAALREVVSADARRQEVTVLAKMDGLDLLNKAVMAKAWRS